MKPPSKACIVCGRSVPRMSRDITVSPPSLDGGYDRQAPVVADLRTLDDCRRHTNLPFVLSAKRLKGLVVRFTVWDGESYLHRGYFCTNRCAMDQGFASAEHGERYTWNRPT